LNPVILSILNLFQGQVDIASLTNFDASIILDKITGLQSSIGHYLFKMD